MECSTKKYNLKVGFFKTIYVAVVTSANNTALYNYHVSHNPDKYCYCITDKIQSPSVGVVTTQEVVVTIPENART